jgi:hypothetical protein
LLLGGNRIGPAGAEALARSERLASLRALALDGNPVGRGGAEALASSPLLGRLAELSLNEAGLDDAGALALARSRHAPDALRLGVGGNRGLSAAAVDELRRRFGAGVSVTDPGQFVDAESE